MADQARLDVWRERVRKFGARAVHLEEMVRLGFWPPADTDQAAADSARARLTHIVRDLRSVQGQLEPIERELATVPSLEQLLAQVRRQRIERVRTQREERRQEQDRLHTERRAADGLRRQVRPPYLGEGVSAGLHWEGGDPARLAALGVPRLESAADIAAAIGIDPTELAWLTFHRRAARADHYRRFTIPKRSGGSRLVSAPKARLRVAQRWLLDTVLAGLTVHDRAMAFRPGRSILTNATPHLDQTVVIRVDLKDFFPSISFRRVKGLFASLGYNEGVATMLALLATEAPRATIVVDGERRHVAVGGRRLPQSACTSPAITNLLCRKLDIRMATLAQRLGFTYTRYCDDLIYSHPQTNAAIGILLTMVHAIVGSEGFTVNEAKTRVMRQQHRQVVTGLVVNRVMAVAADPDSGRRQVTTVSASPESRPRVSRTDLRRFRAFLHQCRLDGLDAVSERSGRNALQYAHGYLAHIQMLQPGRADQIRRDHPWLAGTPGDGR